MQKAQDGADEGDGARSNNSTEDLPATSSALPLHGTVTTSKDWDSMDIHPPPEDSPGGLQQDRGKRLATSPAHSPNKEPHAKKQLWSQVVAGTHSAQNTPSLAAIPVTDNTVSEAMLKSMLLTLQQDLHRELQMSLSQMHDK